jgi:hypothetical protein
MDEKKAGATDAQTTDRAASATPRKQPVGVVKKPPERARPKRKHAA